MGSLRPDCAFPPSVPGAALALAVGLLALTSGSAATIAREGKSAEVFDEAARLVRDNFYDPKLRGLDWSSVVARFRPGYLQGEDAERKSEAINGLLGALHASHMMHVTPEDPRYFQLVDIFRFGLRGSIAEHLPYGTSYPGIGVFTREIDGKTFVSGVLAGLPADKANVKVGDEIVAADGADFKPVGSFKGKTGSAVKLSLRRTRGGAVEVVEVSPERIEPGGAFRAAIRSSARLIEANGKRIGYVKVWSYAREAYHETLMEELAQGKLRDADALIWDLRDGWGGAQPGYLDLFNARGPDMTVTDRSDKTDYASFKWRKPVAMLVNGGTRSGKEVLAYGFKKFGYGEVIGTRTAGALLAGRGFLLADGSFLMVAVNDVAVDGERLEGKGVAPTIEVPFEIPYAGGADPQLDKAVQVLSEGTRG